MRFDSIRFESTPYIRVWRAIELYKTMPPIEIPAHKVVRDQHVYFKCPFGCSRMHKIGYANHSSPRSMADMHCPFKPVCCEILVVVDADTPRVSSLFSRLK